MKTSARIHIVWPQPGDISGPLRGGYEVQPAIGAPVESSSDESRITPPVMYYQKQSMLSEGIAISRAPTCSGMAKLPNVPKTMGVTARKTMIVPWSVKSVL